MTHHNITFPVPPEFLAYLGKEGIAMLYPHQVDGMKVLSEGRSLLLATPTSSGKTVVAYYGILRAWKAGLRSLYVVPLRALAEEKYDDMRFFADMGIKVGISTGDYDRPSDYLKNYDILISTSEKVDSLLRNNPSVFGRLGFVVFDEIHNIMDESRGSTLEIVISKIRYLINGVQFAAMSATVDNVARVAGWLRATAVSSDFRPVTLKKYVLTPRHIMDEKGDTVASVRSFENVVADSLANSGQTLIFVRSRKAAEDTASKMASVVDPVLAEEDRKALDESLPDANAPGSEKLLPALRSGVGFHHAGMLPDQRRMVERLFRERKLKVIVATTTLAAGMNLPARSVLIKDVYRYNGFSSGLIPNLEIQQMLGRAGRAKYDSMGYGYICSSDVHLQDVYKTYVHGRLESVKSMIDEKKLRMHVLGLISSGAVTDRTALDEFFSTTLARHEGARLEEWIDNSLVFLQDNDMIVGGRSFTATPFGRKVSELYVDPVTGVILRNASRLTDVHSLLLGICATPDMQGLYVSSDNSFPIKLPDDLPFAVTPENMKVASILADWIDEKPESDIVNKYNIWPADLRSRVELAEWLSHSLYEISRVLTHRGDIRLDTLHKRISDGIREDLVELVTVPNVGRVRARRLELNGFSSVEDIAHASADGIKRIAKIQGFGDKVAEGIVRDAMKVLGRRQSSAHTGGRGGQ
ncbi:MAG: Type III restriction enzyme, res subunit family [Thermoplasmatales archaeon I-plasma]|nr:MAG: Type III restriction enzyme, res subunit family [Thermoplasmatales archaeon I-plasma]